MTKKLVAAWAVTLTLTVMVLVTYVLHLRNQLLEVSLAQDVLISTVRDQAAYIHKVKRTLKSVQIELNKLKKTRVIYATVTAYSPRVQECDNTPYTTAFMKKVHPKYVAVSRDIVKKLGWTPGQKIYIEGVGVRTIGDFMSPKIRGYHIDLFMWKTKDARRFGKRKNVLVVLLDGLADNS